MVFKTKDGEVRRFDIGDEVLHFKGGHYLIENFVEHSETGEIFVIYKKLEEVHLTYNRITRNTYARPLEMFASKTDMEKYPDASQEYRFVVLNSRW